MVTFDDNYISQYEIAFRIMQQYGHSGAVGVIGSAVGLDDRIPLEGMHEMQAAGWDMVSHPHSDGPRKLLELSPEEFHTEVRGNKQWLVDNGFERGAQFIIWPFNAYNASSLEFASRYHHLGFSISGTPIGHKPTGPLITGRVNGDDVELAKQAIDFAARYNQLVVLMYHMVGNDDWVSRSDFERVMAYIDRTNIDTIRPSDLWRSQ
jgi:hypothetical protein